MNWKTDLKLADLEANTPIEITCKRCGFTRYELQAHIMDRGGFHHAYLDQVERALRCEGRFCSGAVRIALIHEDKNEGFVGGMA